MTLDQWWYVTIMGLVLTALLCLFTRGYYRLLLKSEQDRYAEILQRTLLLQQDIDGKEKELEYLKALFNLTQSRPVTAYMTDTQVSQLAMALTTMVQGHVNGMN